MQVPKLMGGTAGVEEFLELAEHIAETEKTISISSVILGVIALAILLISKKIMPKFPMAVVLMAAGAILTAVLPLRDWGIQTLAADSSGIRCDNLPIQQ